MNQDSRDIIIIDHLTKYYGRVPHPVSGWGTDKLRSTSITSQPRPALDAATWSLPPGCLLGFLGPNGAGKTTTIRILMGLLKPTAGRATVFGLHSWKDSTQIRRRVGYLPGELNLYPHLTGRQTVEFVARARSLDGLGDATRLAECLQIDLSMRVRKYSKGTKQKIGIILAMMHRPGLFILDEPTASLDPLVQQTLYRELRDAVARGCTVLFSSHSLAEVQTLCDNVVIMRGGRVVAAKPVSELRREAGQRVRLRLAPGFTPPTALPKGLHLRNARDGTIDGYWRREPDELVTWLGTLRLAGVVIEQPDLEDLFLRLYGPPDAPARQETPK